MCTLRDSFRASFSVGDGQSFSTPLNILHSDWRMEQREIFSDDDVMGQETRTVENQIERLSLIAALLIHI